MFRFHANKAKKHTFFRFKARTKIPTFSLIFALSEYERRTLVGTAAVGTGAAAGRVRTTVGAMRMAAGRVRTAAGATGAEAGSARTTVGATRMAAGRVGTAAGATWVAAWRVRAATGATGISAVRLGPHQGR
jgi:hypothetical protein